jgi:hypothetical protein
VVTLPATSMAEGLAIGSGAVSENVSLDGVIQDPAGDEGFRVGGWVGLIGNSHSLPSSRSTRRLPPRPSCWADAPTSGLPRGGHTGAANWLTG